MGLLSTEHSRLTYRLDFAFHGGVVALLAALLAWRAPRTEALALSLALMAGLAGWSLLEYLLHRHVLHGLQPFARCHAAHHARPQALIGPPTVLTAGLFASVCFLPAWWWGGVWLASALTLGLVTGYVTYSLTHHAVHHWRSQNHWLRQRKLSHGLHHHGEQLYGPRHCGRYGVSSGFWDRVFGS